MKFLMLLLITWTSLWACGVAAADEPQPMRLRAFGVPFQFNMGPAAEADRQIIDEFRKKFPYIEPVSLAGLQLLGGSRTMDMVPFMQIAGDIAPDVMYVNFRQSHTYIHKKLLYPLDKYIEQHVGVQIDDGSALNLDDYLAQLREGPHWAKVENRVPPQCWQVMRRRCPYGLECRFRRQWEVPKRVEHQHVWAFPIGPLVMGLKYDRTLFAQHAHEGVEQRAPRDWEEMLRWAKLMHNPEDFEYGMRVSVELSSWYFMNFLFSAGGYVVEQVKAGDEARYAQYGAMAGDWVCTMDTEEAVEAAYFFARLRRDRFRVGNKEYEGVLRTASGAAKGQERYAMEFQYLDDRFLNEARDQTKGFGPVPAGPGGLQRSEFNSMMVGIFSGLEHDKARRDAAWEYIAFFDGVRARQIRTEKMVEAGLGRFVRPYLLNQFNEGGRFDDVLRQVPPDLKETYRIAFAGGVPEPYGKNCQYVYDEMQKPIGAILADKQVIAAIHNNDPEACKAVIREILKVGTERINQKMLGYLPEPEARKRSMVAWIVVVGVVVIFVFVMRRVIKIFTPPDMAGRGQFQFGRYRRAYLLMTPAIGSIMLWMYWPLLRGSVIAFQDYSVLGDSTWVGAANFAEVLYSPEFWFSMKVSLIYGLLFFVFGFWAPIILAFLLQEVPHGKLVFRTIYYLPAVLTGVVVIFLWRGFYDPEGMINQVLNGFIWALNWLPGVDLALVHENWLDNPTYALFFCLLPTVWAGMGPGCLIYLAALKTVPEELYEAADIDGAGINAKIFRVAVPSIRMLIMINFIGAMIGAIRGSSGFILAMTGGGPYGLSGGATEVIGLKIFYTTFGYLQFGLGSAMAWVLGSMLIGFTVMQLQKLSRVEFRTAGKVA